MKRILLALLVLNALGAAAQVDLAPGFRVLYEQRQYERITGYKRSANDSMSAKALYYIAMAHYMQEQDERALRYFDSALAKGPADADMYYYKGMVLLYRSKPAGAAPLFAQAIAMQPQVADFWAGKGEALMALGQEDSARTFFEKAATLPGNGPRSFIRLGDLYNGAQRYEEAKSAYASAVAQLPAGTESWQQALYNLALTELLSGAAADAHTHFEALLEKIPNDYTALTKLLQCCYALGDYAKAGQLRAALYDARARKKLPEQLADMFCYDQFIWNGRRVLAYEKYDVGSAFLKVKYLFYVLDTAGKVDYRVQAESSAAIAPADGHEQYVLCLVKGGSYFTYWNFVFGSDVAYPKLKAAVINILEGKVKPTSATTSKERGRG